jgi:hypothetical protein
MKCARHQNVDTELSCTRCETPICPKCLVVGAVGMLCKSCAGGGNVLFEVHPARFALAALLGIAAGIIAGVAIQNIGFFLFFISPAIGGAVGRAILWATKGRRGKKVEALAGVSVVVGALLSTVITGAWIRYWYNPVSAIWFVIGLVLCTGAAVARVKYW